MADRLYSDIPLRSIHPLINLSMDVAHLFAFSTKLKEDLARDLPAVRAEIMMLMQT